MKSISKKIYLLLVLAVMSFCAVLFPMSANTAKAEVAFNLEVTKAQVKVQLAADESGNKEWAIMFKATIDAEELAAAEGTEVKFGMLIGPTKLVGDNATHAEFVADGFKTFSHVNSTGIKLAEGATGFDYWAGIRFNETILTSAENKLAAGAMELTAIPFYQVGEGEIVLGTRKAVESRKVLTQSYGEKSDANEEVKIPLEVVNAYAGQYEEKEAYICKSTDRLMTTTEVNGDLKADAGFSADDTVFLGKVKGTGEDLTAILDDDLEVNGATTIVAFTTDGKAVYMNAKHAERVITRFWKEDDTTSELVDYYASTNDKSGSYVKSIFFMTGSTEKTFNGLYVLANDIEPKKAGSSVATIATYGAHTATAGYGFTGTFDGRGKVFDFKYGETMENGSKSSAWPLGGFFPSLYGATVKNLAITGIYLFGAGYSNGVFGQAVETTLENIYLKYNSIGDFNNSHYKYLMFSSVKQVTFSNIVVDCDIASYDYYDKSLKNADGYKTATGIREVTSGMLKGMPTNGLIGQSNTVSFDIKSASNFFAVGSNPIMIYAPNAEGVYGTKFDNGSWSTSMRCWANPSSTVTIYVNEVPKYNKNAGVEGAEIELANVETNAWVSYALEQFVGTEYEEYMAEHFKYARYFLECKLSKQTVEYMLTEKDTYGGETTNKDPNVPQEPDGKLDHELRLYLAHKNGMYDLKTAEEFSNWIKNEANATNLAKFDTRYWNVDKTTGSVTWKGLTA